MIHSCYVCKLALQIGQSTFGLTAYPNNYSPNVIYFHDKCFYSIAGDEWQWLMPANVGVCKNGIPGCGTTAGMEYCLACFEESMR